MLFDAGQVAHDRNESRKPRGVLPLNINVLRDASGLDSEKLNVEGGGDLLCGTVHSLV